MKFTPLPLLGFLVGFCLTSCQTTQPISLSEFQSDFCTCFPEGTFQEPELWAEHCRRHDYSYWKGGTRAERKEADLALREDIREEGKPVVAGIVYAGVRIGGTPWLPTSWRWGFGWEQYPRKYRELTDEEMSQVEMTCPDSRCD